MKKLSNGDGLKMLPYTWTVYLTNDVDFFITPFSLQSLRHRCFFEKMGGITDRMFVYFHLSDEEQALMSLNNQVYFYGAFNYTNVYQIRS